MKSLAAGLHLVGLTAAGLAGLLALSGCGPSGLDGVPATASTSSAPASTLPEIRMPVLAASAVPGVPATTRPMSVALLARDASIEGLARTVSALGFVGGRERIFQGNSRQLTFVDSRALVFSTPAGAAQYLTFIHANAAAYFGSFVSVRALTSPAGVGWLFQPPPCACHLANPALVGIVRDGNLLVWLEINGPAATDSALSLLLADVKE